MSELGIHKDYGLANRISRGTVDVFFSGHTHEVTYIPLLSRSGALVVEAGDDGYLGRMDFVIKENKIKSHWKLIPVDTSIPEDTKMAELVAKAREPFLAENPGLTDPTGAIDYVLDHPITHIAGKTDGLISRIDSLDNSFNRAFTDILRQKAGTNVAITPGFRFDSPVQSQPDAEGRMDVTGDITLEDIFRFFPVGYTLATASITAERFQGIIETILTSVFSSDLFKQSGGWVDGISGLQIKVNTTGEDGERVQAMILSDGNQKLKKDDKISVAGCIRRFEDADVLCSHHGFEETQDLINSETGKPYSPQELLLEHLKSHRLVDGSSAFKPGEQTDTWPASPFIQPLPGARCLAN